jgi:3-deoxy-7-phosphoheptulonate synthase
LDLDARKCGVRPMKKENRRGNGIGYTIGGEISPQRIKRMLPVSKESSMLREERVKEIESVLEGKLDKLLVIVGPCSADLIDPVVEYAGLLGELQPKVLNLILIPRVYTAKPRTTGTGYKGKVIYPDPSGEADIERGIISVRKLHKEILEKTNLVAADEMLTPLNYDYLDDLLGYIAIGARSCTNPEHQEVSSGAFAPI